MSVLYWVKIKTNRSVEICHQAESGEWIVLLQKELHLDKDGHCVHAVVTDEGVLEKKSPLLL